MAYNGFTQNFLEEGETAAGVGKTEDYIEDLRLLKSNDVENRNDDFLTMEDEPLLERLKKLKEKYKPKYVCRVQKNPVTKMKNATLDLIRVDDVRLIEITELMYYSFFYAFFGFIIGTIINLLFPARALQENGWKIFFEIIIQVMVLSVGIFYIKKLIKIIPSPFSYVKNYCPYILTETVSIVVLGVVMMSTQSSLQNKFQILGRRFSNVAPIPFVARITN